jgi:hypothetical protein
MPGASSRRIKRVTTLEILSWVRPSRGVGVGESWWLAFLLSTTLTGVPVKAFGESAPPDLAPNKGLIWRLQQGPATIYVIGSIHVLRPEHHSLPTAFEDAYTEAQQPLLEADLEEAKSAGRQSDLIMRAFYLDGTTLAQHIQPELHKRVSDCAQANNIANWALAKPWFAASLVKLTELTKAGFNEAFGPDPHYLERARQDRKPVLFLESVDFQFDLLSSGTPEQQETDLAATMNDLGSIAQTTIDLATLWRSGDVAGMRQITHREQTADPESFERLVTARTRNWVPQIVALLNQPITTLVIAGAAHRVREQGLINLLRLKGYTIEQAPPR